MEPARRDFWPQSRENVFESRPILLAQIGRHLHPGNHDFRGRVFLFHAVYDRTYAARNRATVKAVILRSGRHPGGFKRIPRRSVERSFPTFWQPVFPHRGASGADCKGSDQYLPEFLPSEELKTNRKQIDEISISAVSKECFCRK